MANKSIDINKDNIYEWLCSIGYLLPRNEIELERLDKLHPLGSVVVNESAIDPFAIINGSRKQKTLSISNIDLPADEQEQLRMAARKHAGLPQEIIDQIKQNQQKKDEGRIDNP